ncbi:histone H1t [Castor canadensis]|jgi:histone H1/5|uniref:Histone H1t n=1 Tax=Castor canadensis TaxID=51338 RepID=A0A250YC54_CASCN|nr:histone H1t [Castor canadensis]
MSETVPAAPAVPAPVAMERPPAKKRGKKPVGLSGASHKARSSSVSTLITEALSVSEERTGMSLAALKKALASVGYDVERNNSRIKIALKSLVTKGILVQTRGTGACGSFRLSKKAVPEGKSKVKKSTKNKKLGISRDSKSPKNAKNNKGVKKPKTTPKKVSGGGRKGGGKGAKSIQQRKSPAKVRAGKPKGGKPKMALQKGNPRKAVSK